MTKPETPETDPQPEQLSEEELKRAQGGRLLRGPRFCGPAVPPCGRPTIRGTADREI